MKKWLLAVVFGTALVLGACGGDDGGDSGSSDNGGSGDEVASAAEDAYKQNCSACHGGNLAGGAGPSLETVGADYSAEEIADIIENGKGRMAAMPSVSEEDRTAIAEWLAEKK